MLSLNAETLPRLQFTLNIDVTFDRTDTLLTQKNDLAAISAKSLILWWAHKDSNLGPAD